MVRKMKIMKSNMSSLFLVPSVDWPCWSVGVYALSKRRGLIDVHNLIE